MNEICVDEPDEQKWIGLGVSGGADLPATSMYWRMPGAGPSGPNTPPVTLGDPPVIAGVGYSIVFQDDFTSFDTTVWNDHIWYDAPAPGGAITAAGSILTLDCKQSDGRPNITIVTQSSVAGRTRAWKRGYFEARMKFTGSKGAFPAFWLFSRAHTRGQTSPGGTLVAEIDIMEGQGFLPTYSNDVVHRDTANLEGNSEALHPASGFWANRSPLNFTTDYHTFGCLWTETDIKFYIDDALTVATTPFDTTDQFLYLLFDMWTGNLGVGDNAVDGTTAASLKLEIDWVKVWQRPTDVMVID